MNVWAQLPRPFFVLAPMDDVTDTVFRQIIASTAAPDLFFTEFINADGLQSAGRQKLLPKLKFSDIEKPLIVQLWGKQPENYYKTAQQLADGSLLEETNRASGLGAESSLNTVAAIDINMGCPVKAVVQNGCCVALVNNRDLAKEIIQATREGAGHLPVSVKTRLGFNEIDLSWHDLLLSQKLDALTIHGRTAKQMSNVPADWRTIGKIRKLRDQLCPDTVLIGNGDVMDKTAGIQLAKTYGLDGIMIGRGVFHDPFIFSQSSPWQNFHEAQKKALYRQHIKLFQTTWPNGERRLQTLNKFCKIYINDFDNAKELRMRLMTAASTDELLSILDEA